MTGSVQIVFARGKLDRDLSRSLISLIPIENVPTPMSQSRPIALYYIIMKIITKVVANCVKQLMNKMTNEN